MEAFWKGGNICYEMSMFSSIPAVRLSPTYELFISHAWSYSAEYESLLGLLNGDASFKWNNLSVPEHDPLPRPVQLPRSFRSLLYELEDRISKAHCVVILSGMYCAHSGWIQSEIEAAVASGKPIVGVKPRGQERLPEAVRLAAREVVGWNSTSIMSAIRRHAALPTLAAMGAPNGPPTRPVKRIGIGDLMRIMPLAGLVPPPSPISEPLSAYRSLLGLTAMPDEKPKTSIFSAGLGLPPEK